MATQIKVLLKNDVPSLGAGGEVVRVRPGFARNFLLPRGLAVPATAGNLALSLGARGGMYIGGGIVPRLADRIDRSPFRDRFEAKGRFRAYLQDIPTFVLQAGVSPALIGASRALDDL